MTRYEKFIIATTMAAACSALSTGCMQHHCMPDAPCARPAAFYQQCTEPSSLPESAVDRPPYRLTVGDTIEVLYQVRNVVSDQPYRLKIEDGIRIVFPYQEKFDQEVYVDGDGQVRCLLIGQVRAAGRTPAELEEQLKVAYGRYLKNPELTVMVKASNVKIQELKKAITTAPRGQSRLVPVKPDGSIDLPYIGEVYVVGKTVAEAKKLIDQRYADEELAEVEVTVQMLEFARKHVYVHGEVPANGVIESGSPLTLMQALIQMGGVGPRGDKSKILLVRRKNLPIPQAIVFDMEKIMNAQRATPCGLAPDGECYQHDIYLADGDIVYVPPTALARANDWIDQVFTRGIRSVMPYQGYVGMEFGYQVRNALTPVRFH